jgi:hypothetical protein
MTEVAAALREPFSCGRVFFSDRRSESAGDLGRSELVRRILVDGPVAKE